MPTPKPRAVRVHDGLWEAAMVAAKQEGTTVSAVVVKALERLVKRQERR